MLQGRQNISRIVLPMVLIGGLYLLGAYLQSQRLNLSEAAGGQYPYLVYAKAMAEQGWLAHFGDRNRMPAIPAVVSFANSDDWSAFFLQAKWIAVGSSLALLGLVAAVGHAKLRASSATLFLAAAALLVFWPKSSFVQAELAFYAFFLLTWVLLADLLRRGSGWLAGLAGAVAGLTFLIKSSVLPLLAAYLAAALLQTVRRGRGCDHAGAQEDPPGKRAGIRALARVVLVAAVFLLITAPYLLASLDRFGRPFYNVNSTFFMWCDNWPDALDFAAQHDLLAGFPDAPPEEIPSFRSYCQTHTAVQAGQRLRYGATTLGKLAISRPYGQFFLIVALMVATAWILRPRTHGQSAVVEPTSGGESQGAPSMSEKPEPSCGVPSCGLRLELCVFHTLVFVGYPILYAWYVPVGYGDRFLLSLFLPALLGLLSVADRATMGTAPATRTAASGERGKDSARSAAATQQAARARLRPIAGVLLTAVLVGYAGLGLTGGLWRPTPEFVQFYHNEAVEMQRAGKLDLAARNLEGVVALDPEFAPAYRALGATRLWLAQPQAAIAALERAIALEPQQADAYNSLGSAYSQMAAWDEAIVAFRRCVALDPAHASGWYNLGGSCATVGRIDEAREAADNLQALDPAMAARLRELLSSFPG
jgi:cytochrome c-type biogenesis protein CcmH/NrfG